MARLLLQKYNVLLVTLLIVLSAIIVTPKIVDRVYDQQSYFIRREVMIAMRDGVRLYTVITYRKNIKNSPIILNRTPYGAHAATAISRAHKVKELILTKLPKRWLRCCVHEEIPSDNYDDYIVVYQDIRGRFASQGEYTLFKPAIHPENPRRVDESTDAYDTIAWLVEHLPESNGSVGIVGASYLGSMALMALVNPHPALKAVVAGSPMVDGWIGDDWFHNGAFRNFTLGFIGYIYDLSPEDKVPSDLVSDYDTYLKAGSAADLARQRGIDRLVTLKELLAHPAYDAFWQIQAMDKLLASRTLTVPVMLTVGQWDEEDSYGAVAVYRALESNNANGEMLHLVVGPWSHGQQYHDGSTLGPLHFPNDTAREFRSRWLRPFLDCHLKTNPPPCNNPPVLSYVTGADRWEASNRWPNGANTPLYLTENMGLSFLKPTAAGADDYVSDPQRPTPMTPGPIKIRGAGWTTWLVQDQRFLHKRPDVLAYRSAALNESLHIKGAPQIQLYASTSGRDADWVVKLIDVYPDPNASNPDMAGYELPIGIEIFRGRYVHGFSYPTPLKPNEVQKFEWRMPNVNHVFMPGHQLMVEIQSSLFPLYDRNPQSWVSSIFDAKPDDYVKTTMTIRHGGENGSVVCLPIQR